MTAVIDRRATRNMCTPLVKRIICRRRGHLARGALRTSPGHIRQRYSFRTDKFGFIAKPSQTICVCIFLSFSLCLRLKKCVYIYIYIYGGYFLCASCSRGSSPPTRIFVTIETFSDSWKNDFLARKEEATREIDDLKADGKRNVNR